MDPCFENISGMKLNYHKSNLVTINLCDQVAKNFPKFSVVIWEFSPLGTYAFAFCKNQKRRFATNHRYDHKKDFRLEEQINLL